MKKYSDLSIAFIDAAQLNHNQKWKDASGKVYDYAALEDLASESDILDTSDMYYAVDDTDGSIALFDGSYKSGVMDDRFKVFIAI